MVVSSPRLLLTTYYLLMIGSRGGKLASATVGSFSCHGMDDNHDKINQDCACVAYPCNADEEAALFVVLDGHGDLGDVVSNEVRPPGRHPRCSRARRLDLSDRLVPPWCC